MKYTVKALVSFASEGGCPGPGQVLVVDEYYALDWLRAGLVELVEEEDTTSPVVSFSPQPGTPGESVAQEPEHVVESAQDASEIETQISTEPTSPSTGPEDPSGTDSEPTKRLVGLDL